MTYHTIGQRKGLHIGGLKGGKDGNPGEHDAWFVAKKDVASNTLYVVNGHDHAALQAESLKAMELSWVSGRAPHTHWVYTAKTRYRSPDAPCEIEQVDADGVRDTLCCARVGGDTGAVSGRLRIPCLSRRRHHRVRNTGEMPLALLPRFAVLRCTVFGDAPRQRHFAGVSYFEA
jgi:hypothetical protein